MKSYVGYTEEIADQIYEHLSSSFDATLIDLVAPKNEAGIRVQRKDMPTQNAVMKWRHTYPEFKKRYDAARKIQSQQGLDYILSEAELLKNWPKDKDRHHIYAYCNYLKTMQYVFEKRIWRYNVESRLEAIEEKLGVQREGS